MTAAKSRTRKTPRGPSLEFLRGSPLPLGATPLRGGVNFAVFSENATSVSLVLFAPGGQSPMVEFQLDSRYHKTGEIWHTFVQGLESTAQYGYRMDMQPNPNPSVHRYDPAEILLDPYARAISGGEQWGVDSRVPKWVRRSMIVEDGFDWGDDQPLNIPLSDSVIYEMHVRGFTRHPSSGVSKPGTFAGVVEKIPYLRSLGITAVELLPVNEFEESDSDRYHPETGERLLNYWGYQPIGFFAPNATYAFTDTGQVNEFRELVKHLHAAGMEVILDVVFNHTAEGDERGPVWSFRGVDNSVYYIVDPKTGRYHNYSGCGNTVNCNHPVVRDLIRDCLRYWVIEMHVDGFRFDLASILGRGQDGSVLANPPLLERLANDPVLVNTKLIAEAWDAAGLYQVGTFPAWGRWAEWNGKFRDDVRRFVRGDAGMVSPLATRLVGSPDLYQTSGRQPYHSINFITCHDGFTLADLVAYGRKHNGMNGEGDHDGLDENFSWNCGVEGPAASPEILALRRRQQKNFAALLLAASGVPMFLAGDEFGRTQRGNNNAYCQDNEISWMDWTLAGRNEDLLRFFRLMISFRREHPILRRASFAADGSDGRPRIEWNGARLGQPDWSWHSRSLAMHVYRDSQEDDGDHVYLIANAHARALAFELPRLPARAWRRSVDTSLDSPADTAEIGQEPLLADQSSYEAGPRSVAILISTPA